MMSQAMSNNPFAQRSQFWEISSKHLSKEAQIRLFEALSKGEDFDSLMLNLFYFPAEHGNCIGVKLISIPWSNDLLRYQFDLSQQALKSQQIQVGLPECFLNIIHLAALANTRVIIFDPIAPVLQGLPVFDQE